MKYIVKKSEGTTHTGRCVTLYDVVDTADGYVVDTFSLMRDAKYFANKWNNA